MCKIQYNIIWMGSAMAFENKKRNIILKEITLKRAQISALQQDTYSNKLGRAGVTAEVGLGAETLSILSTGISFTQSAERWGPVKPPSPRFLVAAPIARRAGCHRTCESAP